MNQWSKVWINDRSRASVISINIYLHMNAQSVGKGHDFGIRSVWFHL